MKHECGRESGYILIEREKGFDSWYLNIKDYADWIEINFCPFCGEKLE